jgi:hypothetical protein
MNIPLSYEQRIAQLIQGGGDISFTVRVDQVRTKAKIMRRHFGLFGSCFGLFPIKKFRFTVFDRPGIYRIIGLKSTRFELYPRSDQSSDHGMFGQMYDEQVERYGEIGGLVRPPDELPFLISEQQPIGAIEMESHASEVFWLNPIGVHVLKHFERRPFWVTNIWDSVTKRYKIDMYPRFEQKSFTMSGKSKCIHLFLAPPTS